MSKTKQILSGVKRKGMNNLVKWLETTDYFIAPASTRFHGAHKCGLIRHCWNVYTLLREKNLRFKLEIPKESLVITSFLHDLCKVNLYKDKILKNGFKSSIPYETDETLPLGHCTKSIFLINRFMELTEQEAMMIRWHMSWSDYEFKKHIDKVRKLTPPIMAFIASDFEASEYLDEK